MLKVKILVSVVFFFGLGISEVSRAELGGSESTIASDTTKFSAQRKVAVTVGAYTVHELVSQGVSVKEYVSGGKVFAVSWNGRKHPDVQQLLGAYYPEFQTASDSAIQEKESKRLRGRHPLVLQSANLTYQSGGHMGSLHGLAYVKVLVPTTVNLSQLH